MARSGYGERGRPRANDFGEEGGGGGGERGVRFIYHAIAKHAYPCGGKIRTYWRAVGGQKYQVLVYQCGRCGVEIRSNNELEERKEK